jgi:hypothetical protein
MADLRTPALQGWQRANVLAAASCMREQIARTPDDTKLLAAYEGLLDLLDPARVVARRQREQATAARQAAAAIKAERRQSERRRGDRRKPNLGSTGPDRRSGLERRSGRDRRSR